MTEQVNPASLDIDAQPTAAVLGIINREDQKVAVAVAAEIPKIAEAVDRIVEKLSEPAAACSISEPAPVAAWEFWTLPNALPRFRFHRRWCKVS